ncbi:SLC13 family permease [Salinibacterium sp. ZJ77]|uniref:SLC13 family permease n=1 Tax=Salinibacterium sp. ZJ77 TaxID=2708337 RepID=UPI00141E9DD2|nr:SLC13 family permease [Salinibacterium sp. ZJ77]
MRLAIIGMALLGLGAVAIATGLLPASDALAIGERVWPVLLFAVAVTIVAELADRAGVFAAVAERLARLGRGHGWALWLLIVALAVTATVFLSLDTTAVLLTPVVVILARHHGYPPLPFALTTVWLANTGSLLLPVSNLTNLLAEHALGFSDPARFGALMAAPAIVAVVVPCIIIAIVFRREIGTRYVRVAREAPYDPLLFWVSAGVVAALIPLLVSGMPVWIPSSAAAIVLLIVFAVRAPSSVHVRLVPWGLLLFASGLFLVVETAHAAGLAEVLGAITGTGDSLGALLTLSASGAVGANLIDNLPAYLALEQVADSPARIAALLIGVNAGPLITPWASLAVLLWHDRLRSLGVEFSWRRYMLLGLLAAPVTVVAATVALWLSL